MRFYREHYFTMKKDRLGSSYGSHRWSWGKERHKDNGDFSLSDRSLMVLEILSRNMEISGKTYSYALNGALQFEVDDEDKAIKVTLLDKNHKPIRIAAMIPLPEYPA